MGKLGSDLLERAITILGRDLKLGIAAGGDPIDLASTPLSRVVPDTQVFMNLDYFEMPSFYRSIAVLVNPFPGEGVGRTTLEAMSCGIPVIVVGKGLKYPVENGKTGFLVPPEPGAIASAVRYMQDNPDEAQAMGRAARARIEEEFSNPVLMPKLLSVYTELTN